MTPNADRLAGLLGGRLIPGWATVELDRAEREVVAPRGWAPALPAADDLLLGARTRVARSAAGLPAIVLLEPSTEGPLAASLVRFGEGFVVDYVLVPGIDRATDVAREQGLVLSALSSGPFGAEHLVAGSPRWGPHLIVSEDPSKPGNAEGPVTIEP